MTMSFMSVSCADKQEVLRRNDRHDIRPSVSVPFYTPALSYLIFIVGGAIKR